MLLAERVRQAAEGRFGTSPALVVRAPGRVNLIGEHTDYNNGFVLPMAIDRAVWIALRPRPDRIVEAHSLDFRQTVAFSLDELQPGGKGWAEYIKGVAWAMEEAGYRLRGWEGVVAGDVPQGAGLSSSAALEIAAARAFAAVSDLTWDPVQMARLGQRAESHWVGVNCGIMDQMISAGGRAGHALLIDCRSLTCEPVPLPPDTAVLVLDTATRRGLVDSAYNERRAQCEAAARFFGVPALRDVATSQLPTPGTDLRGSGVPEPVLRRARHVVTENARTLQAAEAMREGDAVALGRLMDESHASLRDDFEVSSVALDAMVECARQERGCLGARLTGAGFGGCVVALVRAQGAQEEVGHIISCYRRQTGLEASAYLCRATNGAEVIAW